MKNQYNLHPNVVRMYDKTIPVLQDTIVYIRNSGFSSIRDVKRRKDLEHLLHEFTRLYNEYEQDCIE